MRHVYLRCPICNEQFIEKNNANKNILFQHIKNDHHMYYCIECKLLTNHKYLLKNAIHKNIN